jgi:hypothetical protein
LLLVCPRGIKSATKSVLLAVYPMRDAAGRIE